MPLEAFGNQKMPCKNRTIEKKRKIYSESKGMPMSGKKC